MKRDFEMKRTLPSCTTFFIASCLFLCSAKFAFPSEDASFEALNLPNDIEFFTANSDIYLYIYADPTCLFCKTLHKSITKLLNSTDVNIVYRFFSLSTDSVKSKSLVSALYCSKLLLSKYQQRRIVNSFYSLAHLPNISPEAIISSSFLKVGFNNRSALESCLGSDQIRRNVVENISKNKAMGIVRTPTLVLWDNKRGRAVIREGSLPEEKIKVLLNEESARALLNQYSPQ